jgi:hypothetical protein
MQYSFQHVLSPTLPHWYNALPTGGMPVSCPPEGAPPVAGADWPVLLHPAKATAMTITRIIPMLNCEIFKRIPPVSLL